MPHLVEVLDFVPQLNSFLQFGGASRPGQGALLVGVGAPVRSLQRRFGHFFFDTSGTEWKGEFTSMTVRQHGMVQSTRGEDSAMDDPKVNANVPVTRLQNEARMPFWVNAGFIDPRVQGSVIDVMDLLTRVTRWYSLTALVRPPQKASRGLRGSTNCKDSTYVWMSGEVCLRWVHSHVFPHFIDVVP